MNDEEKKISLTTYILTIIGILVVAGIAMYFAFDKMIDSLFQIFSY